MTVRTDLNGLRVKRPDRPEIYLVDRGYRRWIPNPETYDNLFKDWNGIIADLDIDQIDRGPDITSGALLIKAHGEPEVYLLDRGHKRHIVNPVVMDRYHFDWNKIKEYPPVTVDAIPTGIPIQEDW